MSSEISSDGLVKQTIKGTLIAVITVLAGVLLFAVIIKLALLNSTVIKGVNQFIKIMSVFLGCFFSVKGSKGLIKGGIVGVVSAIITYLIFAMLSGQQLFTLSFLVDLIIGLIAGGISGVLAVNVQK